MTSSIKYTEGIIEKEPHLSHLQGNRQAGSTPNKLEEETDINLQTVCPICSIDDSISPFLSCSHKFCSDCIKGYLESKMQAFQVLNIRCPQDGCLAVFTEKQIKIILDKNMFKRYRDLVVKKKAYQGLSGERLCPKPGCARPIYLSINHGSQEAHITCACGTEICQKCWNVAHTGKSCLEVLDLDFELYAQSNEIKFCMVCKTPVARVEGCLHMTCCVCDYEWCWTCGREFKPNHECIQFWHPSAPSIFSEEDPKNLNLTEKLKKLVRSVYQVGLFIVFFIPGILFWPLSMMLVGLPRRRGHAHQPVSFHLVLKCTVISIVALPLTLVYAVIYTGFLALSYSFVGIKSILARKDFVEPDKPQGPRWKTGNIDMFTYTHNSRPVEEVQNNDESAQLGNFTINENISDLKNIKRRVTRRQTWPKSGFKDVKLVFEQKDNVESEEKQGSFKQDRDLDGPQNPAEVFDSIWNTFSTHSSTLKNTLDLNEEISKEKIEKSKLILTNSKSFKTMRRTLSSKDFSYQIEKTQD